MSSIASLEPSSLLVLRTEAGVMYLRLSRFQSMRLRWMFRHFQVLPSQVLSGGTRRMLDQLCETAVVYPTQPVASDAIVGVIEQAEEAHPSQPFPGSRRGGWPSRWPMAVELAAATVTVIVLLGASHALYRERALPLAHAASVVPPAAVAAAAIAPEAPSDFPAPVSPTAEPMLTTPEPPAVEKPLPAPAAHATAQTATAPVPAPPGTAPATPEVAVATPTPVAEPTDVETKQVSELPQGHFARPVVTANSPAGEVQLNVVIAPDGSVQQVRMVSGNRQLAEAGMRAIRQWHYAPYEVQSAAPTVEETRVKMNFFGPDAVSISSVAVQP